MPDWSPLQIGLILGALCGALWSARTVAKNHSVAGVYMLIERRFWRSLVTGFTVAFVVVGLLASLLATVAWLLHGLLLQLV